MAASAQPRVDTATARQLVELATAATTAYGRDDLGARLRHTRGRLLDPSVRVLIVGEFKQGKSQLVNALLNAPVCPVDDDIATAIPTVVRYAEIPAAAVVRAGDTPGEGASPQRTPVPVDSLARHVAEAGNPGNRQKLTYAEIGVPRDLLARGLVLVDTPGVGGLGSAHGAATMATLPSADAVLLVSAAAQEYTSPELDFLDAARRLCPNIACVLTKVDLYPQWRRIAELDRAHLAADGVHAELLPVSSTLRLHALRTEDAALNEESGFRELVSFLRHQVLGGAEQLARRSTSHDVLTVTEQLTVALRAELHAIQDPGRAEELIAGLQQAKEQAQQLKQRFARWQITLNDGVADLQADIGHDLEDRMRLILRKAEQMIDDEDPAKTWDQFSEWVHQQLASAAAANFVWASQRARWLADQVAEHFAQDGAATVPDLRTGPDAGMLNKVTAVERPDLESPGIGNTLMTGMRGGFGGVLMIGMATTLAGMALLNPLSAAAGLLFGRITVREERKRQLERRRGAAKNAVRQHVGDVKFQVGKDSRDMLREMQRTLRDHFTTAADELAASLTESVQAAQRAVQIDESERARRIRDLNAELDRVAALEQRARALAPEPSGHPGTQPSGPPAAGAPAHLVGDLA